MSDLPCDVAIVGGGPAGSTCASLLRKYLPSLDVVVLEKERFPRDHVGESQLPSIGPILEEMGVWDAVEAAGFPIKIGASYTWGRDTEAWDFDFFPVEAFRDEPRPARFEGQRRHTAFQVDRARYDDILLRHAEGLGATVREATRVERVEVEGDCIVGLHVGSGEVVRARHHIDASGATGLLRRSLGVESDAPRTLRNIAIWTTWRNAEWAVEIGVGATRVFVRSLPYGWLWFIPLGPDRTSIGLVCPAAHYRAAGRSAQELYDAAIAEQREIAQLTANATPEASVRSCKDWSHLAARLAGPNWLLAGESAGFAAPILAAGMALAHASARDAAYTILELERGEHDADWLRDRYDERNRSNIAQHIRFAQYWYAANGCFGDLKSHCAAIAREAGLRLRPEQAWRWLSQGGFAHQSLGLASIGSFDVSSMKQLLGRFDGREGALRFSANGLNVFELNLAGATDTRIGRLRGGRIEAIPCAERGGKRLPRTGYYGAVIEALERTSDAAEMLQILRARFAGTSGPTRDLRISGCLQALDTMIDDWWVLARRDPKRPALAIDADETRYLRSSVEARRSVEQAASAPTVRYNV